MSVILSSLNDRPLLEACLATLLAQSGIDLHEVIVVDMASTDGTVPMLRERFPTVTLLPNAPNRGYGAAANRGARQASGDWLVIANTDVEFRGPECLATLVRAGEDSAKPALVGASLIGVDGLPQRCISQRMPGRWRLPELFCAPLRYLCAQDSGRLDFVHAGDGADVVAAAWFTGAVLLIRRDFYSKLGGFDEGFFMMSEEVDLCARVRKAGGQVLVARNAHVVHVGGTSTPTGRLVTWLAQGAARYTRKHFGIRTLRIAQVLAVAAFISSMPVWLARVALRRWTWRDALTEFHCYYRALRAAVRI